MKDGYQSHLQEQEEARQKHAFDIFIAAMQKIDREHDAANARIKRDTRILFWFIGLFFVGCILTTILIVALRSR